MKTDTKMTDTLHEDQYTFVISRSFLLRMISFSNKFVEKIKRHILHSVISYPHHENRAVCEMMWKKYFTLRQATNNNTKHAHCMLDTQGYKHTLRICNTYYFSTKIMVARTRLNVTSCVHCLSCWVFLCGP